MSRLGAERVGSPGALSSLRSKMKIPVETQQEMHFSSNEETDIWIKDYVDWEPTVARKQVEDAETAIKKEQEYLRKIEYTGLTTREPKKTIQEMLNDIGDSLSNIASSAYQEDAKHEDDEHTELGKQSEDGEPGWVMCTSPKMIQQRMARFRQKQMKLDQLTQPGLRDTANYFRYRHQKYCTTKLSVPAVVKLHSDDVAATPPHTTFGELTETLDIMHGIS